MSKPVECVLVEEPSKAKSLSLFLQAANERGFLNTEKQATESPRSETTKPKTHKVEERREEDSRDRRRGNRRDIYHVKEPEFNPEIKFEYTDDFGNKLNNPKDAFRELCYKFHGKGPSKNKIDKRFKKKQLQ